MQSIITRYHGHTNTKPARISATTTAGKRQYFRANIYETDQENHRAAAVGLVMALGWDGEFFGGAYNDKGAWIWVCTSKSDRSSFKIEAR